MSDQHTPPSQPDEPRRRQSGFSGLFMILGSSYSDMFLGLIRGILVDRIIGPTGRGLIRIVHLFGRYLSNAHLGALHGVSKELPMALGRRDEADVRQIEDIGSTTVILLSSLASLGMVVVGIWFPGLERLTRITIAIGGGIVLSGQVVALYRCVLRAWGTYSVLAVAGVVASLSQFVLILGGAVAYGVRGAILGWLAATLVTLLYLHFASGLRIRPHLSLDVIGRLIRVGLPIAAIIFADVLLRTVDGVIILKYSDAYRLGLYDVAMRMAGYLYRIPEAAGFVLMPRIWERYGARDDVAALRQHVINPTVMAATIMPVMSGIMFILAPYVIRTIVPRFSPCIFAVQIMAMSAVFLALPMAANGLLIALNKEKIVVLAKGVGAALVAAGAYWSVQRTVSLSPVAMAAGVGYAVASFISLYVVLGRYYFHRRQLLTELIIYHVPLLWAIVVLKVSGMAVDSLMPSLANTWWEMIVRLILFLVLVWPLLWYVNSRTGLLSRLRQVVRARLQRYWHGVGK